MVLGEITKTTTKNLSASIEPAASAQTAAQNTRAGPDGELAPVGFLGRQDFQFSFMLGTYFLHYKDL